jgi:hypothetical protein
VTLGHLQSAVTLHRTAPRPTAGLPLPTYPHRPCAPLVMMVERRIGLDWVEMALASPKGSVIDLADHRLTHVPKRIPSANNKVLHVVYNSTSSSHPSTRPNLRRGSRTHASRSSSVQGEREGSVMSELIEQHTHSDRPDGLISVDPELCIGCRTCELACSFHHAGSWSPELSSVQVRRSNRTAAIEWLVLSTCDLCESEEQLFCQKYCCYNAIQIEVPA